MLIGSAVVILGFLVLALEFYAGATSKPVITDGPSAEVERLSLARQAAFAGNGPNDLDTFASIILDAQSANRWLSDRWRDDMDSDEDDPWDYPSLDHIYAVPEEGTREQFERAQRRARSSLAEWERRGVFDRCAELLTLGPIARTPTGDIMNELMFEWMGSTHALSRALAARAHVAAQRGDHHSALDAIEQIMVLGRQVAGLGYLIDWLVGLAIQQQANNTLHDIMLLHPNYNEAWTDRAAVIVRRELVDRMPSLADALHGERQFSADMVQRSFSDNRKGPGIVNGRFLPIQYADLVEGDVFDVPWHLRPLGSNKLSNTHGRIYLDRAATDAWLDGAFERHRHAADAVGEAAIEADREVTRYAITATWRNPMAMNMFHFGTAPSTERTRRVSAAGTLVLLEIERHRSRNAGRTPQSLEQLDEPLTIELRTDPFTQQPWNYAPTPMTIDDAGQPLRWGATAWPYTLRSLAMDGYAPDPANDKGLDPRCGVIITRPVQGPRYDMPPAPIQ